MGVGCKRTIATNQLNRGTRWSGFSGHCHWRFSLKPHAGSKSQICRVLLTRGTARTYPQCDHDGIWNRKISDKQDGEFYSHHSRHSEKTDAIRCQNEICSQGTNQWNQQDNAIQNGKPTKPSNAFQRFRCPAHCWLVGIYFRAMLVLVNHW